MPELSRRRARTLLLAGTAVAAVALMIAALVFEPWKLVIDHRVDEPPPVAVTAPESARPVVLAHGMFVPHEHAGSGAAEILRLPDGSRVLRLLDLRTSNGPKLRVWLTDAPLIEGRAGWYVFDDGRHVDLGDLKGNIGSSNYLIPPDVDLTGLTSVSVWCERFSVSFTAARLGPVT